MATATIHEVGNPGTKDSRRGPITAGLLDWTRDGGATCKHFGGVNGADSASVILLKAQALTSCLSAGFESAHENPECEFALLSDRQKSLAVDAIGDLIMLAKVLVDEA